MDLKGAAPARLRALWFVWTLGVRISVWLALAVAFEAMSRVRLVSRRGSNSPGIATLPVGSISLAPKSCPVAVLTSSRPPSLSLAR